jgi:hypothetical protein
MADERIEWTTDQVLDYLAEASGKRPSSSTWAAYVARGQAPAAARHIGRTPLWAADEVQRWQATRRGQHWRGRPA